MRFGVRVRARVCKKPLDTNTSKRASRRPRVARQPRSLGVFPAGCCCSCSGGGSRKEGRASRCGNYQRRCRSPVCVFVFVLFIIFISAPPRAAGRPGEEQKSAAGMASSPGGNGNFDSGLEIKTRSVEQTLIPLVSQVSRGFGVGNKSCHVAAGQGRR